jgi:hypothetical protein
MACQMITMQKILDGDIAAPAFGGDAGSQASGRSDTVHAPAHKDFREKFYAGFK